MQVPSYTRRLMLPITAWCAPWHLLTDWHALATLFSLVFFVCRQLRSTYCQPSQIVSNLTHLAELQSACLIKSHAP